jgi:hypothetical protein
MENVNRRQEVEKFKGPDLRESLGRLFLRLIASRGTSTTYFDIELPFQFNSIQSNLVQNGQVI